MTLALRQIFSGMRGRYHLWSGLRAYRSGHIRTAGRHLDEALSCGHESFMAFLTRGKVAYRQREIARALECFVAARAKDPTRFSVEGFPDDFLTLLQEQPDREPQLRVRITIESGEAPAPRRSRRRASSSSRVTSERVADEPVTLGDFSSAEEAARHAERPAIEPGSGSQIDWDAEAEDLFGDD